MRSRLALLPAALLALAPAAHAQTKPMPSPAPAAKASSAAKASPAPLPKPVQQKQAGEDPAKDLPPFLGLFGPVELIQQTGFRSQIGRWIEYRLDGDPNQGQSGTMRIQEVGPAERGARWIEVLASTEGVSGTGLKLLTRGERNGNLERLVARAPGLAALELPLDSVSITSLAGGMTGGNTALGELRKVGKETLELPIGRFDTEHWTLDSGRAVTHYWITRDPKIPFTGIVKMENVEGTATAVQFGSNAVGQIPMPAPLPASLGGQNDGHDHGK